MSAIIELQDVTKDYGKLRALNGVTMSVPSGCIGLLGPNGAGKSTLVKVLLGLVSLQRGSARVLGLDIRTHSRQLRELIGYVPEDDCYVVGLTGVEAVRMMGELGGLSSREALRRGHEILDYVGIMEERYREIQTYSTGMKQKIKLAQALVHDPKLLILDEPTNGLDPEMRQRVLAIIETLARKKGIHILLCTHLLHDVERVCDHVVILGQGRVLAQNSLAELQKPADEGFHVRFHGPGETLLKSVTQGGYQAELETSDRIRIRGDKAIPNRVLEWAKECGVQVREIQASRNSLEEIFLRAISG